MLGVSDVLAVVPTVDPTIMRYVFASIMGLGTFFILYFDTTLSTFKMFSFAQLFLRGKPHLQKYMRRLPKTHKKLPMRKQDEPDFYLLDKTNPLPALEDAPIPGGLAASSAIRGQRQAQQQQQQDALLRNANANYHPSQQGGAGGV